MERYGIMFLMVGLSGLLIAVCSVPLILTYSATDDDTAQPAAVQYVRIFFVGDMQFDRYIRTVADREGDDFLFSCVSSLLAEADMVIGNLEGPITSFPSKSVGTIPEAPDNYTFTFPTSTAYVLSRHNVTAVSLANNHVGNFGREGILQTIDNLERANVDYFGDPLTSRVAYRSVPVALAFIGYSEFGGSKEQTIEQVRRARTDGYLPIVFAHWGEEYTNVSTDATVEEAHAFADAGAGLVIGAHPHVIQNSEVYRGIPIYYSLGNFIFDQYFSPEVQRGMIVEAVFGSDGSFQRKEIFATLQENGQTCPHYGQENI
jgi:poly-gamma-glutamate synthesis protein (capsule biosynthesis protein)